MGNKNIIEGSAILIKVGDKVIGKMTSINFDREELVEMGADKNGIHNTEMER